MRSRGTSGWAGAEGLVFFAAVIECPFDVLEVRSGGCPAGTGAAGLLLVATLTAMAARVAEVSAFMSWDSKYVTEGRDNLDGPGLWSAAADVAWLGFEGGVWHGVASTGGYREWNVYVARGINLGPVEVGASYTRLEFRGSAADGDNEVAGFLSADLPLGLTFASELVWSTGAHGGFLQVQLARTWEMGGGALRVTPYVAQGFDCGYVSKDFDGPNHFEVGAALETGLGEWVTLGVRASHSWAGGNLRHAGLGDLTWAGAQVGVSF